MLHNKKTLFHCKNPWNYTQPHDKIVTVTAITVVNVPVGPFPRIRSYVPVTAVIPRYFQNSLHYRGNYRGYSARYSHGYRYRVILLAGLWPVWAANYGRSLVSEVTIQSNRARYTTDWLNKKAQLSLTNPRDAKACQNCFNSKCLQRCRWQYWPIYMRLTAIASEIHEIPRNLLKIQTYGVQGHPRSSILMPIESPYVTCY